MGNKILRFIVAYELTQKHNLDSRVMDKICQVIRWIIPVHDAAIVSPIDAELTRDTYCQGIDGINRDNKVILTDYFYSTKIDSTSAMAWKKVKDAVIPVANFKCHPMALK